MYFYAFRILNIDFKRNLISGICTTKPSKKAKVKRSATEKPSTSRSIHEASKEKKRLAIPEISLPTPPAYVEKKKLVQDSDIPKDVCSKTLQSTEPSEVIKTQPELPDETVMVSQNTEDIPSPSKFQSAPCPFSLDEQQLAAESTEKLLEPTLSDLSQGSIELLPDPTPSEPPDEKYSARLYGEFFGKNKNK